MIQKITAVWNRCSKAFKQLSVLRWIFILLWRGSVKSEIYLALTYAVLQALLLMLPPLALAELNNALFHKFSWISNLALTVVPYPVMILIYCGIISGSWYLAFDLFNRYTYYGRKMTDATQAKYQHEIFAGMLWQPLSFHKQNKAAGVQSQVQSTSKSIYRFLYSDLTVKALYPIITIPLFAIYIMWINPLLILVSIVPFFYVLYLNFTTAPKISNAEQKSWNVVGETAQYCLNRLQNYRLVKMYGNEQLEIDRAWTSFEQQLEAQHDSNVNWRKLTNKSKRIGAVFMTIFVSYIAFGSSWGWYAIGVIISAVWYYIKMFDSFIDLCFTYTAASTMAPQLEKIEPFLVESQKRQASTASCQPIQFLHSIEFKNVYFSHPSQNGGEPVPALSGLSCLIRKGEVTVIKGSNGSGKSTFVDLLAGLDKPESGQILVDRVAINDLSLRSFASLSAYMEQKTLMFNDTIRNNLSYANRNVTFDEIQAAAKRVGIHEAISRLSSRYDSILGDVLDLGLSGGQLQRLQLVRALLAGRQVLILDEPTSGLDTVGIEMIWQVITDQLTLGYTVVMISHRPEDALLANRVITIAHGQVVTEETEPISGQEFVPI